jgi:putative transposase
VSRLRKGPGMRFYDSIFGGLLEPINRRQFQATVEDAYDKSSKSWDHLVAPIYAQLSGNDSLRGVVTGFNANPQYHYHLGTGKLCRSTLSDADARRRGGIFVQLGRGADQKKRPSAGKRPGPVLDGGPRGYRKH